MVVVVAGSIVLVVREISAGLGKAFERAAQAGTRAALGVVAPLEPQKPGETAEEIVERLDAFYGASEEAEPTEQELKMFMPWETEGAWSEQ